MDKDQIFIFITLHHPNLPTSYLCIPNSARPLGSIWVPPPYATLKTASKAVRWGQLQGLPHHFSSLRSYSPMLPLVQCV